MDYAVGYLHKPYGGRAGFDIVFHRTEERLIVRKHVGDFKGHKRILWRGDDGEPYVRFDGKMHRIEQRFSYKVGWKVWVIDSQSSPIAIDMEWKR